MSTVLPCPVCGFTDCEVQREAGDCRVEYWIEYECFHCGENAPTFRTKESWNQYAAAMELALSAVEFTSKVNPVIMRHRHAHDRVMEVFNGHNL